MQVSIYNDLFEVVAEIGSFLFEMSMLKFVILFFVSYFIFPIKNVNFSLKKEKTQRFKHIVINTCLSVVQPSSLVCVFVT